MDQKQKAYLDKINARIEQWGAEIGKLEAKAREASAEQRLRYEKTLADLREQRDEAREQAREIEKASEKSWDEMKSGVEAAWSNISNAWDRAIAQWR